MLLPSGLVQKWKVKKYSLGKRELSFQELKMRLSLEEIPADPFTISELQNPSVEALCVAQKRWLAHFELLNCERIGRASNNKGALSPSQQEAIRINFLLQMLQNDLRTNWKRICRNGKVRITFCAHFLNALSLGCVYTCTHLGSNLGRFSFNLSLTYKIFSNHPVMEG